MPTLSTTSTAIAYLLWSVGSGHLRRDLAPSGKELRHIDASISDHLKFRFPKANRYNVLQKLAYLVVVLILLPLMLFSGLAMSLNSLAVLVVGDI